MFSDFVQNQVFSSQHLQIWLLNQVYTRARARTHSWPMDNAEVGALTSHMCNGSGALYAWVPSCSGDLENRGFDLLGSVENYPHISGPEWFKPCCVVCVYVCMCVCVCSLPKRESNVCSHQTEIGLLSCIILIKVLTWCLEDWQLIFSYPNKLKVSLLMAA